MEHFEALYPEGSRSNEISKILEFIKEGNSIQLVSVPGAGRSNVLGLLAYNTKVRIKHLGVNQKKYHFVNINFSEIRNKSNSEAFKFIFLEIRDSLEERKLSKEYEKVNNILHDSLETNDEMVIFQGLKKTIDHLAIERDYNIILLFDRFETYVPTLTSEFFANLKLLRNRAKYKFSVVFSLNRPLEDIFEKEILADFYELIVGHTVYLPLMDKPGIDFRISYLEKSTNKKIGEETRSQLLVLAGGHGKLTRLCAEAVLGSVDKPNESDLKEFLLSQKGVEGALFEIYSSLTPAEQNILFLKKNDSYLEAVDLLKNKKVEIPLLAEFITKNKPKIENLDLNALSDNLSSMEFRLLSFFSENPDRIVERNEIVEKVWKDSKTVAGVTDQALDQLIFRLRKKIEKDPNSPTHLLTVKGRGFKFQL